MRHRITLYAEEGMMLTDGEHFGKIVHLEMGTDASAWREITEEDYEEILARQQEQIERI